jgi:hypothetical protein
MQRKTLLRRGLNTRTKLMSLFALGIGATAYGITRRRRNGNGNRNAWQQVWQPLKKMFPTR